MPAGPSAAWVAAAAAAAAVAAAAVGVAAPAAMTRAVAPGHQTPTVSPPSAEVGPAAQEPVEALRVVARQPVVIGAVWEAVVAVAAAELGYALPLLLR